MIGCGQEPNAPTSPRLQGTENDILGTGLACRSRVTTEDRDAFWAIISPFTQRPET